MKKKLFVMAMIATVAATFSSCAKKGCTDANAENYYDKAKKDDGSCTYKTSVAFYYTQATADSLWYDGSDYLDFYVDGKKIGTSNTTTYINKPSSCENLGPINTTIDLGGQKEKNVSYKVVDDLGDIINSGTVTVKGGYCKYLQVVYP